MKVSVMSRLFLYFPSSCLDKLDKRQAEEKRLKEEFELLERQDELKELSSRMREKYG